jgi:hypothetical protein
MKKLPIKDRLLSNMVVDDNGCWIWQGKPVLGGYGRINVNNKNQFAHIVSYETFKGPRPPDARKKGLYVCHTCDVPACINPDHLWLGTASQNQLDCIAKGRGNRTGAPAGVGRKFTAEQIIAIRKKYAEGLATQVEIAAELGVHQGYVSLIMRRQVWKTV